MDRWSALHSLMRIAQRLPERNDRRRRIAKRVREILEELRLDLYSAMHAALAQGIHGDRSGVEYFLETTHRSQRRKFRDEATSSMFLSLGLLRETKGVPTLLDVSKGGIDQDAQGYALLSLACMGDAAHAKHIRVVMHRNSRRKDVLRSGSWALALIGGRDDVPALLKVLKSMSPNLHQARGAAAIALGVLADREVLASLVEIAKSDEDASTRAFAIVAIGWLVDRDPVPRIPALFSGLMERFATGPTREAMTIL